MSAPGPARLISIILIALVGGCAKPKISYYEKPTIAELHSGGDKLTAVFDGHDRKVAKTKLDTANVEQFDTLHAFLITLPEDQSMLELGISKEEDSDRVAEERRNVRVKAWLYAAKFEDDQDFHLIIGNSPSSSHPMFLNAEVTGLPSDSNSSDYLTMRQVRQQLFDLLGEWPKKSGYGVLDPPMPIWVQGSLFYDVDHAPGVVGPQGFKPDTSWEIHPVSDLVAR